MRSPIRAALLASGLLLLAACHHKDENAPLAYVPADTAFVAANLKPLDDDASKALLAQANSQLPAQLLQLRQAAADLHAKHEDGLANFIDALIKEFDGKTSYQQIAKDIGTDIHGLGAFYGVGLMPVLRTQVTDAKRFEAFVQRLATAAGSPLQDRSAGSLHYRSAALGQSPLQLLSAIEHDQAVLALVPADAKPALIEQVLGAKRPAHSVQDEDTLEKLAESKDYSPYATGYLDLTRLAPLITGGKDPMAQAFYDFVRASQHKPAQALPPMPVACRDDINRVASRVPRISLGYTKLVPGRIDQRVDIRLAKDITQPFADLAVNVPGLGDSGHVAPFDLSVAMPMMQVRDFWSAQAKAVTAKPFTCPALNKLNDSFAKLGAQVGKLGIPPLGDVLGFHLTLDQVAVPAQGKPTASGALLVASKNPAGLLAIGQAMVPALAKLDVGKDGKPVALPAQLAALAGGKAWVAMNNKALGVAAGDGEDAKLGSLMQGSGGKHGALARMYVSGPMYGKWITTFMQRASQQLAAKDPAAAMRLDQQAKAMKQQFDKIESVSLNVRMENEGLVLTSSTRWKQ
ncbi:hypothetical protein [Oleiagrimonas sp. C23AA]|uniref:hypothetical protein n=1 Tax=Oleiagrimonas sp. C23AA TaxID=2719047 RepID=UPI00141F09EC|nr:hypothetical protein [Oleiagrimonas sp. C23AA]NII11996.1 hypothetical protein [Oleiagrimonas sp. C23AA]